MNNTQDAKNARKVSTWAKMVHAIVQYLDAKPMLEVSVCYVIHLSSWKATLVFPVAEVSAALNDLNQHLKFKINFVNIYINI